MLSRRGSLLLLVASAIKSAAGQTAYKGRICHQSAGEPCAQLWDDFASDNVVVVLAFDSAADFAGAQALVASIIKYASTPVLFAVASASHADVVSDWFAKHSWSKPHSLCSVDPRTLPEVWSHVQELTKVSQNSTLYHMFLPALFPRMTRAVYIDIAMIVQVDITSFMKRAAQSSRVPLLAVQSQSSLRMVMDDCCEATRAASKLLREVKGSLDQQDVELLEELKQVSAAYMEFNDGLMVLDLPMLQKSTILDRMRKWLVLGARHKLFHNVRQAWNLAAWKQIQYLDNENKVETPGLEMQEAALHEDDPILVLRKRLRGLSFVHYSGHPKPWQVDWAAMPAELLFDDGIWRESFRDSGGAESGLEPHVPSLRQVSRKGFARSLQLLRPAATALEHLDYGLFFMEGSRGVVRDLEESRWRFAQAAEGGAPGGQFMRDGGLQMEQQLTDKQRFDKLEGCWELSKQRAQTNENHVTLRELYKMSLNKYLAQKAPSMIPNCYWRMPPAGLARSYRPEDLDQIFSPTNALSTPPLPPRLGQWMETMVREKTSKAGPDGPAVGNLQGAPIPEKLRRWLLVPALLVIGSVVAIFVRRLGQMNSSAIKSSGKRQKKKKGA